MDARRADATYAGSSRRAASSPCTWEPVARRPMASPGPVTEVVHAAGDRTSRRCWPVSRSAWRRSRGGYGDALAAPRRRDDRRGRQAAAAAARGPRRRRRGRRRRRCAPASPSSSSTARRSCTTTCSTPPRCAAARRPSWPPAGARWRSPPATCSSRAPSPCCAEGRRPEAVRVLSDASAPWPAASCCSAPTRWDATVTVERYLLRCELKTARLFEAACRLGAMEAGANGRAPLGAFGRRIGLAFQILDDVLDVSGPGRAHRQAPRHRPARRHRHAAAHPRPRARPRARGARPALGDHARAGRGRLRPDRRDGRAGRGRARRRWSMVRGREGRAARAGCRPASAARWSSSPTASSRATPGAPGAA